MGGSPAILQATLTSTDVSGLTVSTVATDANGGVAHTLAADTATMPAGAVRYTTHVTALQPLLIVPSGNRVFNHLAVGVKNGPQRGPVDARGARWIHLG